MKEESAVVVDAIFEVNCAWGWFEFEIGYLLKVGIPAEMGLLTYSVGV